MPALADETLGPREEPEFFIITDGGSVEAGRRGELADFHFDPSIRKMRLDLKLTLSFSIWGWDVANPNWREAMKNGKERFVTVSKKSAAGVTLALWMGSGAVMGVAAQGAAIVVRPGGQMATAQRKFYCNMKPQTPDERA